MSNNPKISSHLVQPFRSYTHLLVIHFYKQRHFQYFLILNQIRHNTQYPLLIQASTSHSNNVILLLDLTLTAPTSVQRTNLANGFVEMLIDNPHPTLWPSGIDSNRLIMNNRFVTTKSWHVWNLFFFSIFLRLGVCFN